VGTTSMCSNYWLLWPNQHVQHLPGGDGPVALHECLGTMPDLTQLATSYTHRCRATIMCSPVPACVPAAVYDAQWMWELQQATAAVLPTS
jgi:hypothetical protein